MRTRYPSDISKEQFEKIRKDLTEGKKRTHPRKYELYDIFCAVLYLLKEGCTWRAIPHDFPEWQNVRYHYDIWAKPDENGVSILDRVLRKLVEAEREKFANEIKNLSGAEVEVVKRNELHTFAVLPKRWIVERSFAWLDKYRRLWKNCERNLQNSFQMISLAFIRLLLKRY